MAGEEISREEFYHALSALTRSIDSGFAGTNARLDRINGRVGATENKITAIETLMDERDKQAGKDNTARAGGFIGSAVGAAALIWQWISKP